MYKIFCKRFYVWTTKAKKGKGRKGSAPKPLTRRLDREVENAARAAESHSVGKPALVKRRSPISRPS
jgi:hypothetical protein